MMQQLIKSKQSFSMTDAKGGAGGAAEDGDDVTQQWNQIKNSKASVKNRKTSEVDIGGRVKGWTNIDEQLTGEDLRFQCNSD